MTETIAVTYHCPLCNQVAPGEIERGTDWGDPAAIALCPHDGARLSELRLNLRRLDIQRGSAELLLNLDRETMEALRHLIDTTTLAEIPLARRCVFGKFINAIEPIDDGAGHEGVIIDMGLVLGRPALDYLLLLGHCN